MCRHLSPAIIFLLAIEYLQRGKQPNANNLRLVRKYAQCIHLNVSLLTERDRVKQQRTHVKFTVFLGVLDRSYKAVYHYRHYK